MYPGFLGIPATGYVQHVYPGIPLTEYVPSISRYTHHRICPTFVGMMSDITCDVICLWLAHSDFEPFMQLLKLLLGETSTCRPVHIAESNVQNQNLAIFRSVLFLPTEKLVLYPNSFPLGYEEQDYETHEDFYFP